MATAHLTFGYLGAGKTTLARRLELDHSAVRFTPDEWMAALFGRDPPLAIFREKEATILALMEPLWLRCLEAGVDVVLDFGFWSRAQRDEVRTLVAGVGARSVLYELSCPEPEARRRIDMRNQSRGQGLYIPPGAFDTLKARFEALGDDEARSTQGGGQ